jgi:hypothetical protein
VNQKIMKRLIVAVLALLAPAAVVGAQTEPAVVRSRPLVIDHHAFANLQSQQHVTFALFDDVTINAVVERSTGPQSWSGRVEGQPPGRFTLVTVKDAVAAIIRAPGVGTYRIRRVGDGHVAQQIDETANAPCAVDDAADPEPQAALAMGLPGCADGSEIDVMVFYTPLARADAGGTAAIEADANLFVAEANDAYANSQIGLQINLVHLEEIDYDESGTYSGHLAALANPNDGIMDYVHGLRYHHSADMVSLLVADGTYCGIAYLMPELSPAAESAMFSITTWYCGGLVFAHELGHNMGCCHVPGDGGGCTDAGLFSYSVGYRYYGDSGTRWRTVMAYSPGSRIPNFSNPDVFWDGEPTGVPVGDPQEAENALTINQTRETIASFRCGLPYCEQSRIVASDGSPNDTYGFSSATSGDTAIVGAVLDGDSGTNAGSAYVLRRDPGSGAWSEDQKLTASDAQPGDFFGQVVAISGNVAIVGAPGADDLGEDAGKAYIFSFDSESESWLEQDKLLAPGGTAGDRFGSSVAVSGDIAVVGAPLDDDNGPASGSGHVFRFDSGTETWIEQVKLLAPAGGADDIFGAAVAISGDIVVVGAPSQAATGQPGTAYVYRFDAGASAWPLDGELAPSPASTYDAFGTAVAVDGDRIIVGASADDDFGSNSGAAYVYGYSGSAWELQQKLLASDALAGDGVGIAVDIHGEFAIVGATGGNDYGQSSGAAYVFRGDDGAWPEAAKLLAPGLEPYDLFGISVAVDGLTAFVGSLSDEGRGSLDVFDGFSGRDCNDNGQLDDCEIINGQADDANGNGVPDECDVPGDFDGDGSVGITDFLILLARWGPCPDPCPPACVGDVDDDCEVGVNDFLFLLAVWD